MAHDTLAQRAPRLAKVRRAGGFAVGALLLIAACTAVLRSQDALAALISGLTSASWGLRLLAVSLPAVNWVLISVSFWLLTRRYGAVRLGEMHALIGSAWLLNYLPMRPGMIGRIAYHKSVHGIRVQDSVRIMVLSVALTGIATCVLLGLSLVAWSLPPVGVWFLLALPGVVLGGVGLFWAWRAGSAFTPGAALCLAGSVRFFDILAWVGRYAVVFALIGHPLTMAQAAFVAAVSQVAMMIPLTGNGVGIREWGIALALPFAAGGLAGDVGLSADLLNRAAELCVALPVGLIAAGLLMRAHRRGNRRAVGLQSGGDPVDPLVRTDS
jgi:hypothetical protein